MGGSGDPAEKTQQQIAMERRQRIRLDEETAASERRLKAVAQKQLGKKSLMSQGTPEVAAPAGPTITQGFMKAEGGGTKKTPEGRGRKSISGAVSGAVGGVASSSGAMGAISGSKKSKKKALLGGLF